ncbi:ankyrin repeat domain-containing protein 26 [Oryctolagus cuniculus]|uniref:ankyrin repeat domain-containing protein 26 n=1 Tax=Oryctolagus cuniculus TaxID=9986 RepID=UPI00387916F2
MKKIFTLAGRRSRRLLGFSVDTSGDSGNQARLVYRPRHRVREKIWLGENDRDQKRLAIKLHLGDPLSKSEEKDYDFDAKKYDGKCGPADQRRKDINEQLQDSYQKTKPNRQMIKKLLCDNWSKNNDKHIEPELEKNSFSLPHNDLQITVWEKQEILKGNQNIQPQFEQERKTHKSNEMGTSENLPYDDDHGGGGTLTQQRESGKTDHQQFPTKEDEEHNGEQLRRKEEQCSKEVTVKQLELTLRTLEMELEAIRNNLNQVEEEQNNTQRHLSAKEKAIVFKDEILIIHLGKQKGTEMTKMKMNDEEQASSKEKIQQLKETNNASIMNQKELRIKELEYELSKMKAVQEDSMIRELEKYKQLYLEEVQVRKTLYNKLNETNVTLAEVRTKLLLEKQRNRALLNTLTVRPILESTCVGNFNNSSVLNRNLTLKENLMIPTSRQQSSYNSMVDYLFMMLEEMQTDISRDLDEILLNLDLDLTETLSNVK